MAQYDPDEEHTGAVRRLARKDRKELTAGYIGALITWTFTGCAAVLVTGLCAFVAICLLRGSDPAKLISEVALPTLKDMGEFLAAVFGPLLAFILGYYFGEKGSERRSDF